MPYWDVGLHKFTGPGAVRRVITSNHLKKCTKITLAQKRICLGDLYEESDDDSTTLAPEQNSKDDYISKAEQKSLELAFARSIFRCGLFLSLSELEPVKLLLIKLLHI